MLNIVFGITSWPKLFITLFRQNFLNSQTAISWQKDYNPSPAQQGGADRDPRERPPQAVELEEAVLGALMLEKDSIIAVQEFITPEAFYTEEHRLIYKAIEELSMELKPIDLYTVTERLKVKKELKKVGGASYRRSSRRRSARRPTSSSTPRSSPRNTCSAS